MVINMCVENSTFILKELICQDKYKKTKLKLNHKNVRSANNANFVIKNLTRNYAMILKLFIWLDEIKQTIITVRNEVAKVMFLHVSVILSTEGVCLSACWNTTPPQTR